MVCARQGFRLHTKLKSEEVDASVMIWPDGEALATALEKSVAGS